MFKSGNKRGDTVFINFAPVSVYNIFFLFFKNTCWCLKAEIMYFFSWNDYLHLLIVQIFNHEQVFDTDVTFSLQLLFPRLIVQSWRSPDQTIKAAMEFMSSQQRRPANHHQNQSTRNRILIAIFFTTLTAMDGE